MKHLYPYIKLSFCLLFLFSCTNERSLTEQQPQSPVQQIEKPQITLSQAVNVSHWLFSGKAAIQAPLNVKIPYRQTGFLNAGNQGAVAIKFKALRGQNVQVHVKSRDVNAGIFAGLTDLSNKTYLKPLHLCEPGNGVTYSFNAHNSGYYLLNVLPELMKSSKYEIEIHTGPSLVFPVAGKNSNAIGSFWGAIRDNGKRFHQGVDIFAAKGTPVVAVADGFVHSSGYNLLGGNYIRLYDTLHQRIYYYAHLDSQLVNDSTFVKAGEIIGTIGNTGNAEFTAPHLHFSINYPKEGPVDPLYFIMDEKMAPPVVANPALAGKLVRVTAPRLNVRTAPGEEKNYLTSLKENEVCRVIAVTDNWLWVNLPGNKNGFVSADYVQEISGPQEEVQELAAMPQPKKTAGSSAIFHKTSN